MAAVQLKGQHIVAVVVLGHMGPERWTDAVGCTHFTTLWFGVETLQHTYLCSQSFTRSSFDNH